MSDDPGPLQSHPVQPADLFSEDWMLSNDHAHLHPYEGQKGVAITDKACKHCKYCGNQYDVKASICPECRSPDFRILKANQRFNLTPRKVTAQNRKNVTLCWNIDEDPMTGQVKRHKLDRTIVSVVNLSTGEYYDEERCKACGIGYTKFNGRAATDVEIAQAKAGKIAAPTKLFAGYGMAP